MLADATGQHFTRISRIENGIQPPTDRNIQDWCTACGAEDQIPDLIATARVVESAYLDWARQSRAGLKLSAPCIPSPHTAAPPASAYTSRPCCLESSRPRPTSGE